MFYLAEEMSKMGYRGIKIAFVDDNPDHRELNSFGETVATNRGISVKMFKDVIEAEKWLVNNSTYMD